MIYSSNQSCQLYVMKKVFFLFTSLGSRYRVYLLGSITTKNNTNNNNFIFDVPLYSINS